MSGEIYWAHLGSQICSLTTRLDVHDQVGEILKAHKLCRNLGGLRSGQQRFMIRIQRLLPLPTRFASVSAPTDLIPRKISRGDLETFRIVRLGTCYTHITNRAIEEFMFSVLVDVFRKPTHHLFIFDILNTDRVAKFRFLGVSMLIISHTFRK